MADLIDGYFMLFSGKKQSLVFKKLGKLFNILLLCIQDFVIDILFHFIVYYFITELEWSAETQHRQFD